MSASAFARHIGVPPNAITALLNGTRGISAGMALRLGAALRTDPRYWTNLQSPYEAKIARAEIGEAVAKITPLIDAA